MQHMHSPQHNVRILRAGGGNSLHFNYAYVRESRPPFVSLERLGDDILSIVT